MFLPPRHRRMLDDATEVMFRNYLNAVHQERLRLLTLRIENASRLVRILGNDIGFDFGRYPDEMLPVFRAIQERLVGASRRRVRRVRRLLHRRDKLRYTDLQRQNTETYMIWASRDTPALPLPFITPQGRQDEVLMRGDRLFLHIQSN